MYRKRLIILVVGILMSTIFVSSYAEGILFSDTQDKWYCEYVDYVSEKGLISGYEDMTFRGENEVTTAEFATILYRIYINKQNDDGIWYSNSKKWVEENNLYSNDFVPDKILNREEIAELLFNSYKTLINVSSVNTNGLSNIKDYENISQSKRDAVAFLVNKKIIIGDENGNFNPKSYVTRGETATLLTKYIKNLKLFTELELKSSFNSKYFENNWKKEHFLMQKRIWIENAKSGITSCFIGDSYFNEGIWKSDNFKSYYRGRDVLEIGIGATQARDWNNAIDEFFSDIAPKNIIVNLGTNDFYNRGAKTQEVEEDLKSLFSKIHSKFPNSKVYYFSVVQRDEKYKDAVSESNDYMKKWISEREWITFLDIEDIFTTDMLSDGVHPKLENYKIYVEALNEAGCVFE